MNSTSNKTKDTVSELEELRLRINVLETGEAESKRVSEALLKVNRALKVLSSCNHILTRTIKESEFLSDICRMIVAVAGYRLAWVGFAEQDPEKTVRPAAFWGFEEGYLETARITWADTERGRGPTGTAIRTGKPSVARNILTDPQFAPWRVEAARRGYSSSVALPLIFSGRTFGALNIYAEEPDAFDPAEVALLSETADDLAFGIMALRTNEERKQAEETVKRLSHRNELILNSAGEGIVGLDIKGNITFCNPAAARMLGYRIDELIGKHGHTVWHHTKADGSPYPEEECPIHGVLKDRTVHFSPRDLFWKKDGTNFPVQCIGTPITENGNLLGQVVTFNDLSEMKKMEDLIQYQAHHDLLTQLPNKALFLKHLDFELAQARSEAKKLAILFLDIDRFKNINDSFGYAAGDRLLQDIGARLKSGTRDVDTVARFGGDEFTILLSDVSHTDDVIRMVKKILSLFEQPYKVNNYEISVTVSIGISIFPDDSEYANTLLKNAGIALFYAKERGKNVYQFYRPDLNIGSLERMILENSLRQTLKRGELVVYYQPQLDLRKNRIVGAEALVRWEHPELGLLNPLQFLPIAEEIGFTMPIDEWVLRTVCAQSRALHEAGYPPINMAVNLSARQFEQQNLLEMVSQVLHEAHQYPACLVLEITESIAMRNIKATVSNVKALTDMGIRISIDDFGTGYSSLSYLKKLPLYQIKIDQSFIRHLTEDADYQAIVNAIIAMAHSLRLKVIAEGVETEGQRDFLVAGGCDEIQGYLVGQPTSFQEFKELIGKG